MWHHSNCSDPVKRSWVQLPLGSNISFLNLAVHCFSWAVVSTGKCQHMAQFQALLSNVLFHKISIPSPHTVFWFEHPQPSPTPFHSGNSSLVSCFPIEIWIFETPPPTPSEFPVTIHGVGVDYCLEPHDALMEGLV